MFADSRGDELGGEADARLAGVFEEPDNACSTRAGDLDRDPGLAVGGAHSGASHILFNLGHGVSLRQDILRRRALPRGRPRARRRLPRCPRRPEVHVLNVMTVRTCHGRHRGR
ncbi:hypothetical protein OV079_11350 [Nannocystis pusilla]|uniref:Uncharacterized protein n=1 Tax=Nannocystis pusilla TaxID=889268 RepID=A0A9X3IW72_9BACT|nr:hypothetical protein [Nannocystis pusilla]MCY1006146.1 hypothetical protein [Nannocystis pusilla]